jgi:hypothetical protein
VEEDDNETDGWWGKIKVSTLFFETGVYFS